MNGAIPPLSTSSPSATLLSLDDLLGLLLLSLCSAAYLTRGTLWDKPNPLHHLWFEKPQNDASTAGERKTRNIATRLEELKREVVIFWGSQSGNAENLATRLARQIRRSFAIEVLVADLSDYDAASIAEIPASKLAIFILSTYGEGDPPDNVNELWSWIRTEKEARLPSLRYAAFGLGNSNYKEYNHVIDVVSEAFDNFGAQRFLSVGRGDEAKGTTVEDLLNWQDSLFIFLKTTLNYQEQNLGYQAALSCYYDHVIDVAKVYHGVPIQPRQTKSRNIGTSKIYAVKMEEPRELFMGTGRSCLELKIDLTKYPELKYKTGDHLALWPENPNEEIERLLSVLRLQEHQSQPLSVSVIDPGIELNVPTPTTLNALFKHYLEICGPVSRDLILQLVQFAPSEQSKTLLKKLASEKDFCAEYLGRKYMNIGRLLEDVTGNKVAWTSMPLSFILENIQPMKPRYYSISSSSIVDPQRVTITALVSNTIMHDNPENIIPGLATNYMVRHKVQFKTSDHGSQSIPPTSRALTVLPDHHLHIQIRRSKFKLPLTETIPIIMVASGTGIAPFRAFLQERVRLQKMGRHVAKTILFYGLRTRRGEYLYEDEIQEAQKGLGSSLEVVTVFSRDELATTGSKRYIQDRVKEHFANVATMLTKENAVLYICGSASMGHGVVKILEECFVQQMGWEEARFTEYAAQLKRARKWQEDVWG